MLDQSHNCQIQFSIQNTILGEDPIKTLILDCGSQAGREFATTVVTLLCILCIHKPHTI